MLLSQSGAEATILTSLTRSWRMIANQTDRYVAIMKKDAAQRGQIQLQVRLAGSRSVRQPATPAGRGTGTSTNPAPGKHR